jgi:ankyrin repeat protein
LEKLKRSIDGGMNVLIDDAKAFIFSAIYGQKESLDLLVNHLIEFEKTNILRHCFLEACAYNQREIVDYLIDKYFYYIEADEMTENAFKSCIIGGSNEMLLYLSAKHGFKVTKELLDWLLKNDYSEAYLKVEIILLNQKFSLKDSNKKKETIKI